MYVCVCVCVHACMCARLLAWEGVRICMSMYLCVGACVHECVRVTVLVCLCGAFEYVCANGCSCGWRIYVHVSVCMRICVNACYVCFYHRMCVIANIKHSLIN